jgi:hypothetical protein
VLRYFWWVAGDFAAGRHAWSAPVLALALVGALLLARRRRESVILMASVIVVPAVAFTLTTLNSSTSPQARHLIFVLPFFSILLALPLVELARSRPPVTSALALVAVVALLVGEVRWAHERTPQLFDGAPATQVHAREAAGAWLAATRHADDLLLGYEPVFLQAWESNRRFSSNVIPRADPALFASSLKDRGEPLGHGVWVFDASDSTNVRQRQKIPFALPSPQAAFEGRVFGPYLVIRSRRPLRTPAHYVDVSERVMRLGRDLGINDADVNLKTMLQAKSRL